MPPPTGKIKRAVGGPVSSPTGGKWTARPSRPVPSSSSARKARRDGADRGREAGSRFVIVSRPPEIRERLFAIPAALAVAAGIAAALSIAARVPPAVAARVASRVAPRITAGVAAAGTAVAAAAPGTAAGIPASETRRRCCRPRLPFEASASSVAASAASDQLSVPAVSPKSGASSEAALAERLAVAAARSFGQHRAVALQGALHRLTRGLTGVPACVAGRRAGLQRRLGIVLPRRLPRPDRRLARLAVGLQRLLRPQTGLGAQGPVFQTLLQRRGALGPPGLPGGEDRVPPAPPVPRPGLRPAPPGVPGRPPSWRWGSRYRYWRNRWRRRRPRSRHRRRDRRPRRFAPASPRPPCPPPVGRTSARPCTTPTRVRPVGSTVMISSVPRMPMVATGDRSTTPSLGKAPEDETERAFDQIDHRAAVMGLGVVDERVDGQGGGAAQGERGAVGQPRRSGRRWRRFPAVRGTPPSSWEYLASLSPSGGVP